MCLMTSESDSPEKQEPQAQWYVLKCQVNREERARRELIRRAEMYGLRQYLIDAIVPVREREDRTKSKDGRAKKVKDKLYPGYLIVKMIINDDSWYLLRETPGVGDFTGSGGVPTPMSEEEVSRILSLQEPSNETVSNYNIQVSEGERVRVKTEDFQDIEGEVTAVDSVKGRVTVTIELFSGIPTELELEYWEVERLDV